MSLRTPSLQRDRPHPALPPPPGRGDLTLLPGAAQWRQSLSGARSREDPIRPRGDPGCFHNASSLRPGGLEALWGLGAEVASFPRPKEGQRRGRALWCGWPGPESLRLSPQLGPWGSGQGEGPWAEGRVSRAGPEDGGPRQAVWSIPSLAPHHPRKAHTPSRVQAPAPPAPCLLSHPPRS